ncbi:MAG: hypothetical protein K8S98_16125 [Planctomycetes bacterium]|nr:hypothetical protein [Planctomycetota bacterium]
MIRSLLFVLPLLLSVAQAQDKPSAPASPVAAKTAAASTPIFPNASCPIMGKPVSTKLFAETEMGRIYVCCKGCVKDILEDVAGAYRTAYPTDKKLDNKLCPVSGAAITKDSPTVVLQGFEFFVRGKEEVAKARENSQIVLAKLDDPKLVDLENETCPVTGEPVARNTFVVIEGTIVRLSSTKLADEIAKDPAKVLKKAKELRVQQDAAREAAKARGDVKKS